METEKESEEGGDAISVRSENRYMKKYRKF